MDTRDIQCFTFTISLLTKLTERKPITGSTGLRYLASRKKLLSKGIAIQIRYFISSHSTQSKSRAAVEVLEEDAQAMDEERSNLEKELAALAEQERELEAVRVGGITRVKRWF